MTSSGKVKRRRCAELFEANDLHSLYRYDRSSGAEQTPLPIPEIGDAQLPDAVPRIAATIESWLGLWLTVRAGIATDQIAAKTPFAEYGLDSLTAMEMSGEIEDWAGIELTPSVIWEHPDISSVSRYIAERIVQFGSSDAARHGDNPAASE